MPSRTINRPEHALRRCGAGGFAGDTNPAYVYTVIDNGPNAASLDDIKVLTDSLGYVLSQGSAFLLDADNTASFDFPANYVVLNFAKPPSIASVGGAVRDRRPDRPRALRDRYERLYPVRPRLPVAAIRRPGRAVHRRLRGGGQPFGVEYTPIVGGVPSLFQGGAAFPGNDWTVRAPNGEEYLARIPAAAHHALSRLRDFTLRVTEKVLRRIKPGPARGSRVQLSLSRLKSPSVARAGAARTAAVCATALGRQGREAAISEARDA